MVWAYSKNAFEPGLEPTHVALIKRTPGLKAGPGIHQHVETFSSSSKTFANMSQKRAAPNPQQNVSF